MSWQVLIGISVFLFSLNGLFHRVLMKDEKSDPYAQTFAFYGLGGLFTFIITLFCGGFHYQMSLPQVPLFLLIAVFGTVAPVLFFKAAKVLEASENSIIFSSQRLWLVFGAFIFLGEPFSIKKLIGTIIIMLGISIALWKKGKFVINGAFFFLIIAAMCYAITDVISFYILRNFDALSFNVYFAICTLVPLLIVKPGLLQKLRFYFKPAYALNILIVSINDTTATLLLFFAYQVGRNASQISPLMATNTIITVLLGILILKETSNMRNKIIGAMTVVLGVLLVI